MVIMKEYSESMFFALGLRLAAIRPLLCRIGRTNIIKVMWLSGDDI